jgi:hypothetical protein
VAITLIQFNTNSLKHTFPQNKAATADKVETRKLSHLKYKHTRTELLAATAPVVVVVVVEAVTAPVPSAVHSTLMCWNSS